MRKSIRIPAAVGVFAVFACLTALTSEGLAQSAFTGIVKDESGAVLPGVSVEARSPELIEQSRSVVSDERGGYKIIDLRPGGYTLTFTLPCFRSVKRGPQLPSNITATI